MHNIQTAHTPSHYAEFLLICLFLFWEQVEQNNIWYIWPIADSFPSILYADLNQ